LKHFDNSLPFRGGRGRGGGVSQMLFRSINNQFSSALDPVKILDIKMWIACSLRQPQTSSETLKDEELPKTSVI
jgi:hypothetical protein